MDIFVGDSMEEFRRTERKCRQVEELHLFLLLGGHVERRRKVKLMHKERQRLWRQGRLQQQEDETRKVQAARRSAWASVSRSQREAPVDYLGAVEKGPTWSGSSFATPRAVKIVLGRH